MRVAPRAWMRRAAVFIAMASALACASCAPHRAPEKSPGPPPRLPPVPPRFIRGYEGLADTLLQVDGSGLAGRRIAIDPGHGGRYRGAMGVEGLTEADVNLGVALRLRDLLASRGAVVLLTRDRDRDFLSPADSTLRGDLMERVRLANQFRPDLFLSVHHNADAGGAHDVNETQTYYKLGDEGVSLDAAQDVHRSLVRNVGIKPQKVVPGNYLVLRESEAPGLLTETSYITNPAVEAQLRLPEKQELEADALFIGLARYFARPVPVIADFRAVDPATGVADSVFRAAEPALRARVAGDFDLLDLMVDGVAVHPARDGDRVEWSPPEAWTGGSHEAVLEVRLGGVGAARAARLRFATPRPPAALVARAMAGSGLSAEAPLAAVRIELRERGGGVLADSTLGHRRIRVRRIAGRGVAPIDTVVTARDGVAWAYFRRVADMKTDVTYAVRDTVRFAGVTRPLEARVTLARATKKTAAREWRGFVLRMPAGEPLRDAPGTREPSAVSRWLNRDGFAVLPRDTAGAPSAPRLDGFRRSAQEGRGGPAFIAIADGALQNRRITIDPEGGGEDPAGTGPGGTRAAHLNLEVARILAGMLTAAGADVHLTRTGDRAVSEVERVQGNEDFVADRYLRIGHRVRRFGYYFSSAVGRQWAERTAALFDSLGLPTAPAAEDAVYPLQQTSCPAMYASAARVDLADDENALLAPGALRTEAYALFIGLAREWSNADWPVDSVEVRDSAGLPVPGVTVTLGGAMELETDRMGRARFVRTERGPMIAEVDDSRVRARAILLDSTRGVVLTGRRAP